MSTHGFTIDGDRIWSYATYDHGAPPREYMGLAAGRPSMGGFPDAARPISSGTMSNEVKVGKHRVVHEKSDVVAVYFGASPTEAEMKSIVDGVVQLSSGAPTFLVIDLGQVETLSAAVRKVIGDSSATISYKAIGMFGASFHIKVIARLVNSAIAIFRKDPFPQAFFDTHDQVTAWFDKLRAPSLEGAT